MGEALGAKLKKLDGLQSYFLHPSSGKKVFIILDACHMIKLVRNVMGNTDLIYECDPSCNKEMTVIMQLKLQEKRIFHGNILKS